MIGLSRLFSSKKGLVAIVSMVAQVFLGVQFPETIDMDVLCGTLAGTAGLHSVGQGIADRSKAPAPPAAR